MRSRGAATANEARKPGIPSGRFTASTTTSPAKSVANRCRYRGVRSEEHPQQQEGHIYCTPGPPHRATNLDYCTSSVRVYGPAPTTEVTTISTARSCERTTKDTTQTSGTTERPQSRISSPVSALNR